VHQAILFEWRKQFMSALKIYLFGSPHIERGEAPVEVDTRKAIALAAYLALNPQPSSRDTLAALFWPEVEESRAKSSLRRTLWSLNRALDGPWLDADRDLIRLQRNDDLWIDVDAFHAYLAQCGSHPHPAEQVCPLCLAPLAEAAALYTGDFMVGFSLRDSPAFDDWQFYQAESLRRTYVDALQRLVLAAGREGALEAAIDYTRRWLAVDPLHEPAHRQLMQLYAQTGERTLALRQYRECVRILEQELGVPPLDETTNLYQMIQANQLPAAPVQPAPAPAKSPSGRYPPSSPTQPRPMPLVGRLPEWTTLQRRYAEIGRAGHLIVLEGEAGIGKTRLAEEFVAHVRSQGATVITARCYPGEHGLAYGPFIEGIRLLLQSESAGIGLQSLPAHTVSEVTRLFPELAHLRPDLPVPSALDGPGAQMRFFEAVGDLLSHLLGQVPPGLLFFDDLQWLDNGSLELLTYLVRRLERRPFCLLCTWRHGDVTGDHPLQRLVAEAQRNNVGTLLPLARLSPADVTTLVYQLSSNNPLPVDIEEWLYSETEGLPFYLVEHLAALERGDFAQGKMPAGVRALFLSRLATLDQPERQLLTTAAVIGRSFDYESLQATSGRSEEETLEGLESLLAQGILREEGGANPTYDFSHEKLRELVYEETSLIRRRLLHRRVAQALAHGPAHKRGMAAQIAYHFRLAGQDDEAAHYYQKAGEEASHLYANQDALAHFRMALALDHPQPALIHEAVGDLETLSGEFNQALLSYERAAALYSGDGTAEARIERKIGAIYHRLGEWDLAEEHFQIGLDILHREEADERAWLLSAWSHTAYRRNQLQEATALAQQARDLAERTGEKRLLAQVANILGLIAKRAEDLPAAQHHLEQSLHWANQLSDLSAQVAALNNLALLYAAQSKPEEAIELIQKAMEKCHTHGDRHREAALHNNLADLCHALGRSEEAMAHLKRAVSLFAEIGAELDERQSEIWKLVEW
jgi:DNA-binding SARP family transcriptional activator/predicted ATPase